MWRRGSSFTLLVEYTLLWPLWRIVWRFFKKKKKAEIAIPLLDIYPN
jgi:hypothetical protein